MYVSEDATAHQCQKRYLDSLDPSIKSGAWSPEEDEKLRRAIVAFSGAHALPGTSDASGSPSSVDKLSIPWQDVALFVPGRTNNQCREHYLDSIVKSKNKGKAKSRSARGRTKRKGKVVVRNNRGGVDRMDDEDDNTDVDRENSPMTAPAQRLEVGTRTEQKGHEREGVVDDSNRDAAGADNESETSPAVVAMEGIEPQTSESPTMSAVANVDDE